MSEKSLLEKVRIFFSDPVKRYKFLHSYGLYNWMPDKMYISKRFKLLMNGETMDWNNPVTFNQKVQWQKVYCRKSEYTILVDKYEVKKYVAERIGQEHVIPTLGVYESFSDIDFDKLPDQFVLKCTHDSGSIVICKDKNEFDYDAAKKKLNKKLKHNYYYNSREWPYKDVKPRIIAEKYMIDSKTKELRDYKFLTFNGEPKLMFIATDRLNEQVITKFDYYDMNFKHQDLSWVYPMSGKEISKPSKFDEMKEYARKLAEGIPHVRVDFYEIDGEVYFGEMTFSHQGGMCKPQPPEWDQIMGGWIDLP